MGGGRGDDARAGVARKVRVLLTVALLLATTGAVSAAPALVPQPTSVKYANCSLPASQAFPIVQAAFGSSMPDAVALLRSRWRALGIPTPSQGPGSQGMPGFRAAYRRDFSALARMGGEAGYDLTVNSRVLNVAARDGESLFDAIMTLAQLAERRSGRWVLPCVDITDAPAMRRRIVSDDVSRGPFPTMAYAKARIRTLASLKINGWSPYMEQVVVDPRAPYVASPNGWTPAQLHELAAYARRFYVTLIPEQQTFAHMHETLKWETFAPLAELPHGYLLAGSDPRSYDYLGPLIRAIAAAAAPIPFFHLGADEPIDLGRGRTPRTAQTFATHVTRVAGFLPRDVRPMIWDDAIQQDHTILNLIPRDTIVVAFHYGVEASYRQYLDPIAAAGLSNMIAPGAANWNEIYPDLTTAYANVARFTADGRDVRGTLGMFMTVWHDDGESLYEATWPALAYAASSAWQQKPVDGAGWHRRFAAAFFGTTDDRYADALDRLRAMRDLLRPVQTRGRTPDQATQTPTHARPSDPPDYLFWHDPFAPELTDRFTDGSLSALRTSAEAVLTELWNARPPLHPQAAAVMRLAALRYDQLGRRLQIGREAHAYYDDALAAAAEKNSTRVYRSLGVAKYLCWELRDALSAIAPEYAEAWRYESTEPGLQRVLVRYANAEADAQRCADRIDTVMREDYLRHGDVPSWDVMRGRP